MDHAGSQSMVDLEAARPGGSLELGGSMATAHRRSPVVAEEQEGATTVLIKVVL
jgi:hypothetical protein